MLAYPISEILVGTSSTRGEAMVEPDASGDLRRFRSAAVDFVP